jgi:hypothetical protein
VITEAGNDDNVAALVYIAGFAPDNGESVATLIADPLGLSPITTVGRFDTVEAAQIATDEVWASR